MQDSNSSNKFSPAIPELQKKVEALQKELQILKLKSSCRTFTEMKSQYENTPAPFVVLDNKFGILFANQELLNILGYEEKDVLGKSLSEFLYRQDQYSQLIEGVKRVYGKHEKKCKDKVHFKSLSRGKIALELSITAENYEDIGRAVNILFQDVTERENFREAYKNLVENSLQAIFILQDLKIVFANKRGAEISGYSVEELTSFNARDVGKLIHPADRDRILNFVKRNMRGERVPPKHEFRAIKKDGSVYWIESLSTSMNYNGKPAIQVVQLDVSEKKQAEEAISNAENKYIKLVEQSIIGVYIITEGKFTYVNPRFAQIFGYDTSEIVDILTPKEVVYHEDWEMVKGKLEQRIVGEIEHAHYFFRALRKNKSIIHVEVFGSRAQLDGKPCVIGMILDISHRKENEAKLNLLSTALETAANGVLITDRKGNIVYTNSAFTKLTGYTFEEVLGENPKILRSGEHDQRFYKQMWNKVLTGEVWEGEIINRRKDGTFYIEEQTISPVVNEKGKIVNFIGIKSDITQRKKAEYALKESERRFRKVLENIHLIGIMLDNKARITFCNDYLLGLTGWKREEVLKKSWFDYFIPAELREDIKDIFLKAVKGNSFPMHHVNDIITKQGKKRIISWSNTIILDNDKKVIGLTSIGEDITDRIIAQNALKESEGRFRSLYENAMIGIYRTTPEGKILMANPALLKMLGYDSFEDYASLRAEKALYTSLEVREKFKQIMKEKGEVYGFNSIAKRKDNTEFFIRENARAIKEGTGAILYYEGTVEDITATKAAEEALIKAKEEAEKSNKLKSEFLAQMSHEIRTPINVILSFSNLIRDEVKNIVSDDLYNSFGIIDNAAKRTIRTIDLMLNMSQLQTGLYEAKKQEIDLYSDVIVELHPEFHMLAKEKNLFFNVVKKTEDSVVYADEYSVRQILDNLIHNAIKYTNKGKVEVILYQAKDSKFMVDIKDTGIGISEEYMQNLFQPFTQEERGYTRKYEGNGLGLALVKKYCELNNAEIKVTSEKGKGTKFSVIFEPLPVKTNSP